MESVLLILIPIIGLLWVSGVLGKILSSKPMVNVIIVLLVIGYTLTNIGLLIALGVRLYKADWNEAVDFAIILFALNVVPLLAAGIGSQAISSKSVATFIKAVLLGGYALMNICLLIALGVRLYKAKWNEFVGFTIVLLVLNIFSITLYRRVRS